MSSAVLSMGSNVGDRMAHLSTAVHTLWRAVRAVSSVYRTPPWGPIPQADYYNLAVLVDDDHTDARGWLRRCHELEEAAGRARGVRWGPRTLDVDVISVDTERLTDPDLTLPHPRAHQRAFVLIPWAEIDPTAQIPGHGDIEDLIADFPDAQTAGIVRVGHVR